MLTTYDNNYNRPMQDPGAWNGTQGPVIVPAGKPLPVARTVSVRDGEGKPTTRVIDSTGAFMVGELERLDQTLHMPLAAVSWGRDIDLREDVTIGDEVSSFTLTTFGSAGGLGT